VSPGLLANVDGVVGPVFADVAVLHVYEGEIVAHDADGLEKADGGDLGDGTFAVIAQEGGDEFFLDGLDDVGVAGAIDIEEHGDVAIDLGDVALEDDLGKDGADEGLAADVFLKLAEGNAEAEFDDVKVAGCELGGAARCEIDLGVVGEDAILLKALAFAAYGADVDAGALADAVIGFAGVADEFADDEALLIV
jgi:hypothetical protein